jgi:hypothetical protein
VAAASKRDQKSLLPREPHRGDNVGDPGAARDQRWPPVDRAVPDLALVVEGAVARCEQLAAEVAGQLLERLLIERDLTCGRAQPSPLPASRLTKTTRPN